MARKQALAIDEYEVLDNGVIIIREEVRKYEVNAGLGKTFGDSHYYFEETIALARRYADEDTVDCNDSECCDPNTSLEDAVSGFYPKGEAVKARKKNRENIRLGLIWESYA